MERIERKPNDRIKFYEVCLECDESDIECFKVVFYVLRQILDTILCFRSQIKIFLVLFLHSMNGTYLLDVCWTMSIMSPVVSFAIAFLHLAGLSLLVHEVHQARGIPIPLDFF